MTNKVLFVSSEDFAELKPIFDALRDGKVTGHNFDIYYHKNSGNLDLRELRFLAKGETLITNERDAVPLMHLKTEEEYVKFNEGVAFEQKSRRIRKKIGR